MERTIEVIAKTKEYLDYVERHVLNVRKAWEEINVKCRGMSFDWLVDDFIWNEINININNHDLSKLSEKEFVQYRQFFYPTSFEEKNKDLMEESWRHHLNNNAHHWQHWSGRDYEHPNQQLIYLIENICDWMAMGYEFGDTAKDYYEKNSSEIKLPDWAVKHMYEIFEIVYPIDSKEK